MSVTKYCIVCLTTGVKFYSLKDYSLGQIYSDLTKIPVTNWNQDLCIECAYLIQKYQKFKLKCLRTDDLLSKTVSLTGLTESVLEKMQEKFKISSDLAYSEITTEDVTVIDPDGSNIEEIKPEISDDDDGLFILLKNDNMPVEYSKENLSISDKSTVNSAETHSRLLLNPRVVLERLEDIARRELTSLTLKPTDSCNDWWYDSDFNDIDDDNKLNDVSKNEIEACDDDAHSNSSWTNSLNYDENLSIQIPDSKNLINGPDDEPLHSNSSWTAILNSLSSIDTENKKHFTKMESDDYIKNFYENKNLSRVQKMQMQKENNRIHFKTTIKHIKEAVELITMIDKPKYDESDSDIIVPTKKWGGLTKSEYLAKLVENLEKDGHTVVQFLTKEQATNEVLNRAKSDNYIRCKYKCNLCYRGYKKQETFANHMLKHSPKRGPYNCEYCHCRYPKKKFLNNHMNNIHRTKFSCKLCPYVCDRLDRATNHVRSHEGTTFDCQFCDKKFNVRNSLFNHVRIKHQDKYETQYICEFCGNSFHTKKGFNMHKEKLHYLESNEKLGPACELCGIHFASQQAWDRHLVVSNKHIAENTISTASSQYEETHKTRKEVGPRKKKSLKYTCEFCGLKFAVEYWYKMHLHKYHDHPKPSKKPKAKGRLTCEICGEHFSVTTFFKEHLMKHTGERPYKCQYCGKSYRVRVMLNVHENTHTRAKIYKCDVCNMEFLLHTSHSRHMKRMHMGLTPYKCLECDHSFVNQSELNAHIRHKHEKIPYPKKISQSARNKTRTSIQLQTLEEEN